MIHPLVRSGIKGAMWYQGESNVGWNRDKYQCAIKQLIADWKMEFQHYGTLAEPDHMPFGFVQLSTINQNSYPGTSVIRWHQTADYGYVPNEILQVSSALIFPVSLIKVTQLHLVIVGYIHGCFFGYL